MTTAIARSKATRQFLVSGLGVKSEPAVPIAERALRFTLWFAAASLVLFLGLPLLSMVWRTAQEGRGLPPQSVGTLREALRLSLVTFGIAMVVIAVAGTPLAYLLARSQFRVAKLIDTLVDLPIVLPPAVAGIALLTACGRYGVIGQWVNEAGITVGFTTTAVVLAQIFIAAPFYVRACHSGFVRVDRDLEEAAADLSASPARVFRIVGPAFPGWRAIARLRPYSAARK